MHKCLEDLVQTYSSFLEQRLKAIDSDNTTTHERKVVFVIMIRARWNGEVIAQSDETVVVEA